MSRDALSVLERTCLPGESEFEVRNLAKNKLTKFKFLKLWQIKTKTKGEWPY